MSHSPSPNHFVLSNDIQLDFRPYFKNYCNCASFVGSMFEYNGNNYLEMIETLNKSEIKKFNKLKILMGKPNYKELKEKYLADLENYLMLFEIFYKNTNFPISVLLILVITCFQLFLDVNIKLR